MGKNLLSAKSIETCDFHGIFSKISNVMRILIYIPSYKHFFSFHVFSRNLLRVLDFNLMILQMTKIIKINIKRACSESKVSRSLNFQD